MSREIVRAEKLGFCFGVHRAIEMLERAALTYPHLETLGAVVHNTPVLEKLARLGIRTLNRLDEAQGNILAISSHGVSPEVEAEIKARGITVIDTTCPFVRRAHTAARRLHEAGFATLVYGDREHPEVKGVLGWAGPEGLATTDIDRLRQCGELPRRLGVLSQTTQVPARFNDFVKQLLDLALVKDAEVRIVDTICHDIRERQAAALRLAREVDLVLVIGGHSSANSHLLLDLVAPVTKAYLVENAREIDETWFAGCRRVGLTSGASTSEDTIREIEDRLR
jgi:4-hydroxy-3-methylbut-2-en-1-yl diphosphate reductase